MDKARRELVREYKQTPRPAGVGAVRNTASGKILLVASTDVPALLNRHLAQLRLGAHRNAALQADWDRLGADGFAFEVLDTVAPADTPGYDATEDVATLEALWLDKLRPFVPAGYNPVPKAR